MDSPFSWRCASPWPVMLRSKAADPQSIRKVNYGLAVSEGLASEVDGEVGCFSEAAGTLLDEPAVAPGVPSVFAGGVAAGASALEGAVVSAWPDLLAGDSADL